MAIIMNAGAGAAVSLVVGHIKVTVVLLLLLPPVLLSAIKTNKC